MKMSKAVLVLATSLWVTVACSNDSSSTNNASGALAAAIDDCKANCAKAAIAACLEGEAREVDCKLECDSWASAVGLCSEAWMAHIECKKKATDICSADACWQERVDEVGACDEEE